jgi:hypothetical protein
MKIVLTTENIFAAARLKDLIIKSVKGDLEGVNIDTWSYTKSSDKYDILFHNLSQYVNDSSKNVLFRVEIDGVNVIFSSAWWTKNPEPSIDMICLHMGRLTELLLTYFRSYYSRYSIIEF